MDLSITPIFHREKTLFMAAVSLIALCWYPIVYGIVVSVVLKLNHLSRMSYTGARTIVCNIQLDKRILLDGLCYRIWVLGKNGVESEVASVAFGHFRLGTGRFNAH